MSGFTWRSAMLDGLPDHISSVMDRYMGGGQGDSSGSDGTSSGDSDDDVGVFGGVAKAVATRAKIRYLTSLSKVCIDVIVENRQKISASPHQKLVFKKMGTNYGLILDLIMKEMWPGLEMKPSPEMKQIPCKMQANLAFLEMLLHVNTEELNFDLLKDKKEEQALWKVLTEKCPNLKKIVCEEASQTAISALPLQHLLQFKKLESIEMLPYTATDQVLKVLADFFPNLKHLVVTLDKPSVSTLAQISRLKELEKLYYSFLALSIPRQSVSMKALKKSIAAGCLAQLPKIKWLGLVAQPKDDMNPYLKELDGRNPLYKVTHPLALERVVVDECLKVPAERLPMIKSVLLTGPVSCTRKIAKFDHLESLEVTQIKTKQVMLVMKKLGRQLKHLKIVNVYLTEWGSETPVHKLSYDFYDIFSLCPNLESFYMENTKFCEDPSIPLTGENFKNLKKVTIEMCDMQGYQMPLPIMEHLLRAEKMEHLKLYFIKCLPKALSNVLGEGNKNHFQQLKYWNSERIWVRNEKGFISSLKKVVARAPRLQKMEIGCLGQGVDEFKRSGLKQMCAQIPGLVFLTDYDNGDVYHPVSQPHGVQIPIGNFLAGHFHCMC